jgi:hypothetical protein
MAQKVWSLTTFLCCTRRRPALQEDLQGMSPGPTRCGGLRSPAGQQLLVVFQGPSAYISPNWYATKHEAGKVVPTWNYAVVHAHCSLKAIHDPAQLLQIIAAARIHPGAPMARQ